jgi:hypothetical protein
MKPSSTFAQLDLRFDEHPRYFDYGAAEMGLIACAITCANRLLSDGIIPRGWPSRRFGADIESIVKRLVTDGVWKRLRDGNYEIVGYLDHNRSKQEVEEMKQVRASAGRVGGQRSAQAKAQALAQANGQALAQGLAYPIHRYRSDTDQIRSDADTDQILTNQERAPAAPLVAAPVDPPSGTRRKAKRALATDDVSAVFGRWVACRKARHPKGHEPRLDDARAKIIRSRLDDGYDVATLQLAVEGIWLSAWHLGENDRKTEYTDIRHALGDGLKVDKFAELASRSRKPPAAAVAPETPIGPCPPDLMDRLRAIKPKSIYDLIGAPKTETKAAK